MFTKTITVGDGKVMVSTIDETDNICDRGAIAHKLDTEVVVVYDSETSKAASITGDKNIYRAYKFFHDVCAIRDLLKSDVNS